MLGRPVGRLMSCLEPTVDTRAHTFLHCDCLPGRKLPSEEGVLPDATWNHMHVRALAHPSASKDLESTLHSQLWDSGSQSSKRRGLSAWEKSGPWQTHLHLQFLLVPNQTVSFSLKPCYSECPSGCNSGSVPRPGHRAAGGLDSPVSPVSERAC